MHGIKTGRGKCKECNAGVVPDQIVPSPVYEYCLHVFIHVVLYRNFRSLWTVVSNSKRIKSSKELWTRQNLQTYLFLVELCVFPVQCQTTTQVNQNRTA